MDIISKYQNAWCIEPQTKPPLISDIKSQFDSCDLKFEKNNELHSCFNPFTAMGDLIDFTLSNARRFYSSKGENLAVKGLRGNTRPVSSRIMSITKFSIMIGSLHAIDVQSHGCPITGFNKTVTIGYLN